MPIMISVDRAASAAGIFRYAAFISIAGYCAVLALGTGFAATHGSQKADRILVLKAERRLELLRQGRILKSYPMALGWQPIGPKQRRGDGRTPEGLYVIDGRSSRTRYHRMLHISYPNPTDLRQARAAHLDPGRAIAIHGMPNRYGRHDPTAFYRDWTDGCIAVGNIAIEEIWAAVDDGTPVEIRAR